MLHIQLFENVVPFLKDARMLAVFAYKWFPVISVDCLQDSLK